MLQKLRSYPALIIAIPQYEQRIRGSVEQIKAVARLTNGSRLYINEVWLDGKLGKYAYYWLTPTDAVIRGWDNAPHHPEIDTYPHHTHQSGDVQPSQIRSLDDVLAFLAHQLISEEEE